MNLFVGYLLLIFFVKENFSVIVYLFNLFEYNLFFIGNFKVEVLLVVGSFN